MQEQPVNVYYSEDYIELFVFYGGTLSVLEQYSDYVVDVLSTTIAVVHLPISQFSNRAVQDFSYAAIPKVCGLITYASLEASGIQRLRNIPNFNLRGSGVLLGIVDTGIDYTNPVFRYADGTTRIISIWDQTISSANPPGNFNYGTEYTREQIDLALASDNPFEIVPSMDTIGHGTMVAGIAGGNEDIANDFAGVAPDAEFVVVKLKPAKGNIKKFFFIPEDSICYQENDIGNGMYYLLNISVLQKKPLSVCLALGTSQGNHTGMGTLSGIANSLSGTAATAVTVAAGNEGNSRHHYLGSISKSEEYDTVELNVGENESGFSMELWGRIPSIFSIDILSPSGEYIPRIAVTINDHMVISFVFEQTIIYIDFVLIEARTGSQLILMRFDKPAPGIWRINVYERSDIPSRFNIWLPMNNFISENTFFVKSDPYITILEPGNSPSPITATAYNYEDDSLYVPSSRGFSGIGIIKPEIAAPGVNMKAPAPGDGFADFSGTSVSAAHTAGVVALLLEWGVVRDNYPQLSTVEIKKLMIRGADRDENIIYPNRDWGYGILDVFNVFDSLRGGIVV